MANVASGFAIGCGSKLARVLVLAAGLSAGGCAQLGGLEDYNPFSTAKVVDEPIPGQGPASELERATEYWGQEFAKNPKNLDKSLNYARNLKALGQKGKALNVLQQASMFHANDRRLNSEYGRLALELDQIAVAKKLLAAADDPAKPDWRVISARGTVLAKEGQYADAIPYYKRALELSANQPSVLNNLALAYAMNGEAAEAEAVLRSAAVTGPAAAKVRQNLAIVLGLQGKYDEATQVGSEVNSTHASANTALLKSIVGLDAKPSGAGQAPAGNWETAIAQAGPAAAPATPISAAPSPAWAATAVHTVAPATTLRSTTADASQGAAGAVTTAAADPR